MTETARLQLSRVLPASCAECFEMWLDAQSLRRWMCTGNTRVAYVDLHPVVGGSFRIDMLADDGRLLVHTGQYLAIERPHRLVFTWNSSAVGEHSSRVTVEFHEQGENCRIVLLHELPPDDAIVASHRWGWTTILDRLERLQASGER